MQTRIKIEYVMNSTIRMLYAETEITSLRMRAKLMKSMKFPPNDTVMVILYGFQMCGLQIYLSNFELLSAIHAIHQDTYKWNRYEYCVQWKGALFLLSVYLQREASSSPLEPRQSAALSH